MKIVKQQCQIVPKWGTKDLYERCEYAGRISHKSEGKIAPGTAEEFVRKMVRLGHESVFEFARVCFGDNYRIRTHIRRLRDAVKYNVNDIELEILARSVAKKYPVFFEDIEKEKTFWRMTERVNWCEEGEEKVKNFALDWIAVHIVTNRAVSHQLVRYRNEVVFIQESQRYCKYKDDVVFIDPCDYFEEGTEVRAIWENHMARCEDKYNQLLKSNCSAESARLVLPNSTKTELIMYARPITWMHFFDQRCTNHADKAMYTLACMIRNEMRKKRILYHG